MSDVSATEKPALTFDVKRDVGKKRLRQLKRIKALLMVSRKLRLPIHRALADSLWRNLLVSLTKMQESRRADVKTLKQTGSVRCESWSQLKYWTYLAASLDQHELYDRLLTDFDERLDLVMRGHDTARFLGSGHGQSTLNTYRSLPLSTHSGERKHVFEKIYYNDFNDIFRVRWLECHYGTYLRSAGVYLPRLLNVEKGDWLTVTHSELVEGARLADRHVLDRGLEVIEALTTASLVDVVILPAVSEFHSKYTNALLGARHWLYSRQPAFVTCFNELSEEIEAIFPRVLAHGDLHCKNMLSTGAVLDWDNCGLFPIGYDLGLMLSRTWHAAAGDDLEVLIKRSAMHTISSDEQSCFITATLYFMFVFGAEKKSTLSNIVLDELLRKISLRVEGDVAHA